jgi:hypothetical protein
MILRRLPLMMAIIILFTGHRPGPGRAPAGRLRDRGAASGGIAADLRRPGRCDRDHLGRRRDHHHPRAAADARQPAGDRQRVRRLRELFRTDARPIVERMQADDLIQSRAAATRPPSSPWASRRGQRPDRRRCGQRIRHPDHRRQCGAADRARRRHARLLRTGGAAAVRPNLRAAPGSASSRPRTPTPCPPTRPSASAGRPCCRNARLGAARAVLADRPARAHHRDLRGHRPDRRRRQCPDRRPAPVAQPRAGTGAAAVDLFRRRAAGRHAAPPHRHAARAGRRNDPRDGPSNSGQAVLDLQLGQIDAQIETSKA